MTPTSTPSRVGTKVQVHSSVKQANGSTVAELEYLFTENLDVLNHSAPVGAKIPARMVIRVTQNAEGVITSVESLSGQPQVLVEALVRQTVPQGLPADEGAVAEGAGEGAAVGGGKQLLTLSKGLKWGGWAAFVAITGYQLYKATPEQRPRVATQAVGGLAGSVAGTYLVCNALLDLETFGWGLVICGFFAGGAGAYAGSELAGEAYDEATATDLSRALHELDSRNRNERILFNLILGYLGTGANCLDAEFVKGFLSTAPQGSARI